MIFDKLRTKKKENFEIYSPVKGDVIDITKTNDPLFKSEGLGKGVGIIAEENTLVSPVNGEIKTFFPTKHAIGITSEDGVDILIHVGIDTVELNGSGFDVKVKQGDQVKQGQVLVKVDLDQVTGAGKSLVSPVVFSSGAMFTLLEKEFAVKGEEILRLEQ